MLQCFSELKMFPTVRKKVYNLKQEHANILYWFKQFDLYLITLNYFKYFPSFKKNFILLTNHLIYRYDGYKSTHKKVYSKIHKVLS